MQDDFIKALSDPTQPVPGGGAAAAYAGAIALALFEKMVRVEMRRPSADENEPWHDLLKRTVTLAQSFRRLCDRDAASYLHLARVKKSGTSQAEITIALQQATDCPIRIMEQACSALDGVARAAKHIKSHLLADLQVVCELLDAAGRGARQIAQANVILMADPNIKIDYQDRIKRLLDLGRAEHKRAETAIRQRR